MNCAILLLIVAVLIVQIISYLKQNQMALSQAELAQQLTDLRTQLGKVSSEVTTKLQELADAISNQGNASPEVEAALTEVKTAVQGIDDLIPDTTQ